MYYSHVLPTTSTHMCMRMFVSNINCWPPTLQAELATCKHNSIHCKLKIVGYHSDVWPVLDHEPEIKKAKSTEIKKEE